MWHILISALSFSNRGLGFMQNLGFMMQRQGVLRKCRLWGAFGSCVQRMWMTTRLGAGGEHYEGPPCVDYSRKKNPSGVTPETVAHVELARRIATLKYYQKHLVVPVIREWMAEGNDITRYGLVIVRHKLRRRKRFHHALEISNWIAYRQRIIPYDHKEALNHIDLMSRVNVRRAKFLFTNLPVEWRTREAYTVLLSMYVRKRMFADAEAVYHVLRKWGLRSVSPINMMLTLYQKSGSCSRISEVIKDAEQANIPLDRCSFNILLPVTFNFGGVTHMENLMEMMKNKDLLDEHTYCMLARFYGKAGMNDKAREMLLEVENGMETGRFYRLRRTYNCMIVIYGVLRDVEGVKRIWDIMRHLELTCEDYVCMMKSFAKVGLYEEAEAGFFKLSEQKRMHLNICNAFMEVFVASNSLSRAEWVLCTIYQAGYKPDAVTYHKMITVYLGNGNIQRALDFFRMERDLLIKPFMLTRDEIKQKPLLPRIDKRPWVGTCAIILEALADRGLVVPAEQLLRSWRVEKWGVDVRLYNALLRAYVVAKEPATGFLKRLEADGVMPDKETMSLLAQVPERPLVNLLH